MICTTYSLAIHGANFPKLQFATGEVGAGVTWLRQLSKLELKEEIVEEDDQKQVICRYTPLGLVVGIGE